MDRLSMRLNTLVATLMVLMAAPAFADGKAVSESKKVSANERIELEVMRGDVDITVTSKEQFSIKGTLDEEAEGYEFTSTGGVTRFEVKMPRRLYNNGYSEDKRGSRLTVEVPQGARLSFEGVSTSVKAKGVQGGADITTVNGSIDASELAGKVSLQTVNGNIESRNIQGHLKLATVNGEIKDQSAGASLEMESVNGELQSVSSAKDVEVSTVNGEVNLALTGSERVEFSTVNGQIDISLKGSKAPRISGSSVSGALVLTLPDLDSARISVEASAGGDIENKLTNDKVEEAKYGPMRNLDTTLGDGDGRIELETVSGEVVLKRN